MANMNEPAGFGFIAGRGRERAQQILDETEAQGLDPQSVLTRGGGYLAPLAVVKAIAESDDADARDGDNENNVVGEKVEGDGAGEPNAIVEVNGQQVGDGSEIVELKDGSTQTEEDAEAAKAKEAEAQANESQTLEEQKADIPASETDEQKAAREAADAKPAGNASTEDWSDWAVKYKGYDASEKLTRAELIKRFDA